MTVELTETWVDSLPFAPEQTLSGRIADRCERHARAHQSRTLVAAFAAGGTVYLILAARQS